MFEWFRCVQSTTKWAPSSTAAVPYAADFNVATGVHTQITNGWMCARADNDQDGVLTVTNDATFNSFRQHAGTKEFRGRTGSITCYYPAVPLEAIQTPGALTATSPGNRWMNTTDPGTRWYGRSIAWGGWDATTPVLQVRHLNIYKFKGFKGAGDT